MVTGLTYSIIPVYIYIEYNGGGTKESPARQAARDGSKWVVVSQAVNGIMRVVKVDSLMFLPPFDAK